MTTHKQAPPSAVLQQDRTAFYEEKILINSERRRAIAASMTWLRPVKRLLLQRDLHRLDTTLAWMTERLAESRAADTSLSTVTTSELADYAATEHSVAVVEHSRLAGSDGTDLLVEQ